MDLCNLRMAPTSYQSIHSTESLPAVMAPWYQSDRMNSHVMVCLTNAARFAGHEALQQYRHSSCAQYIICLCWQVHLQGKYPALLKWSYRTFRLSSSSLSLSLALWYYLQEVSWWTWQEELCSQQYWQTYPQGEQQKGKHNEKEQEKRSPGIHRLCANYFTILCELAFLPSGQDFQQSMFTSRWCA